MDSLSSNDRIVLIAITSLIVAALFQFFIFRKKDCPNAPPKIYTGMPLLGNAINFAKGPLQMIEKLYLEHGKIFTVPIMGKSLTFLIGSETHDSFFKYPDEVLSQNEVYGFMKPVFGSGIVYDAEPSRRSTQMKAMSNGLRSSRLQAYVPMIENEVKEYMKSWGDSGTFDLIEILSKLTILTASRCLHGNEIRENMHEKVSKLYHDLDQGITPVSFFFPNAPIGPHFRRNAARKEMCRIFGKVIKARKEAGEESNSKNLDILQIFMDMKYKDGGQATNDEITGLLIALLFAGQHTSSISSTWTLSMCLLNPEILGRVKNEQELVVGGKDAPIDFEKLGNLELLHNCMKEALRMFPPLIFLMRYAKKSFTVPANGKEYTVPKGHIVVSSPAVAMRIPTVFKEPSKFDPDRYAPPREEHKVPYAYLGFGGGMHQCMGQQFGFLQVKTILSILIRNYDFEMIDKALPDVDYSSMVAGPKGKIMMRYKRRD